MIALLLAVVSRFGISAVSVIGVLAVLAAMAWVAWFELGASSWMAVDTAHDSPRANLYYIVTIVCLPIQTFLLVVAGLYGARTLRQNLEFKQRDVEEKCVQDYLAVTKQVRDAEVDREKLEAAVRSYWILMIYEFYWWRRGLVSRDLFLIWSEFREREFRANKSYYPSTHNFGANPPPFKTFVQGYEFCRSQNVFRSDSRFVNLMNYLLSRSQEPQERRLWWFQIERFRHRLIGGWF